MIIPNISRCSGFLLLFRGETDMSWPAGGDALEFKIQNSKLRSCDLFMIEFEGKEIREVREVREFKESPP